MTTRMEIVGRVSGRRHWSVEQKLAILHDAFEPGGSVRAAIEQHEVGSGAIYTWRRQAMSGAMTAITKPAMPSFAEVQINEPAVMLPAPSSAGRAAGRSGLSFRRACG